MNASEHMGEVCFGKQSQEPNDPWAQRVGMAIFVNIYCSSGSFCLELEVLLVFKKTEGLISLAKNISFMEYVTNTWQFWANLQSLQQIFSDCQVDV